ncbi:MAG: hypothetical protein EAZ89_06380 [Bacteroidetes bacterium]|jgi:hypothetical protein|nr:MAG: hypothetical protein EAZ89_06380 [Bacteroidota bacterium]
MHFKTSKTTLYVSYLLIAGSLLLLPACKPEDPDEGEETISRVELAFTEGANTSTFAFEDGGAAQEITLSAGKTYVVAIKFLNTTVSPTEDITEEVSNESDEHLVCFEVGAGVDLGITRTDKDANNLEVGLSSLWVATSVSSGTVIVTLRHQPGVKNGTCTVGDTDVEVTFPVKIQ